MEHVDGVPITDYCDAHRLATRTRLALVAQVCAAMQHAHQKGIVHRDLKPSNVLVAEQDGVPVPKVIDFGIAKAIQQALTERTLFTEQGRFIGTPEYMSPEQTGMSGLDVDATTDIYSLGVLLYELLAGALPFEPAALRRAGYAEMQRIIREDEPPRPSTRVSTLGAAAAGVADRRQTDHGSLRKLLVGDLDWITLKAMEKDRARRYASASELAADLERYLHDEPVLATPASAVYRAQKFVRRNRLAVTAATLVAVAVVAGLVVSSALYVQSAREARARRSAEERALGAARIADEQRLVATDQRNKADANATRAEAQRVRADELRIEADTQRAEALSEAYASGLAAHVLAFRRFAEAEELSTDMLQLRDSPVAMRNWEWRYLAAKLDSSRAQLFAPLGGRGPLAFTRDERRMVWATDRILVAWDTTNFNRTLFVSEEDPIFALDPSGALLLRVRDGRDARVVDVASSAVISRLLRSDQPVTAAAFSDGGGILATATLDGVIRFWRPDTGTLIRAAAGVVGSPVSLQFSGDETTVLALTGTAAFLVPVAAGSARVIPVSGPGAAIFHSDSRSVWIHNTGEGTVHRIDTQSGRETAALKGLRGGVTSLAVSRRGEWLATANVGGSVRIWDVSTGRPLIAIPIVADKVEALAFSAGDRYLVAGSSDSPVLIWDVARLRLRAGIQVAASIEHPLPSTLLAANPPRSLVGLSGDGRWAAGVVPNGVSRWDLENPALTPVSMAAPTRLGVVFALAVSRSGRIVAGNGAGVVWLWPEPAGDPVALPDPLDGAIGSIGFSRDGRLIAATSRTNQVRVWDTAGRVAFSATTGLPHPSRGFGPLAPLVTFDASGHRLITVHHGASVLGALSDELGLGGLSKVVETWDISTGRRVSTRNYSNRESVVFTSDGSRSVVSVDGSNPLLTAGRLQIRDAADGSLLATAAQRLSQNLTQAVLTPDRSRLAAADFSGQLHVIDPGTARVLMSITERQSAAVAIAFSTDGSRLTLAYQDGVVQVLDVPTAASVYPAVFATLLPIWGSRDPDAAIKSDRTLSLGEQADALRLLEHYRNRDPAEALNIRSWGITGQPGRPAADYRSAVGLAEAALAIVRWSPEYVGTVGVAQYRAGRYPEALATLDRSLERWSAAGDAWKVGSGRLLVAEGRSADSSRAEVLASEAIVRTFRSMCLAKLGRSDDARAELERARAAAKAFPTDTRLAAFLKEADGR
jgi:WD40 repeat protein